MIGVFDSGHGGLTVLDALVASFPRERFVYLGDHAAAPYGTRPGPEVLELTRAAVDVLFRRGCRLVVLACNTASAIALRGIQQEWLPATWPDNRVLGVLVPMVEAITGTPWHAVRPDWHVVPARTVGVFATLGTVASGSYPVEVAKRAPEIRVVQQACPTLAGLIEAGADRATLTAAVAVAARGLLDQMDGRAPDAVLLGCTHYPLVADLFADALPLGTEVLSQPERVAMALRAYLWRHPQYAARTGVPGAPLLLTTGDPAAVTGAATRLLRRPVEFHAWDKDLRR
ncbi:MAG: glutamate racemase [Rhodospirillales bacterium]|jgi:glutamate racemase